jgi:hypothetical protein
MKKFMIGVGSCALVGKDKFYQVLSHVLKESGIQTERVALADALKGELNEFTNKKYGISSLTNDKREKEIIRPLFVVHGKIRRQMSNGKYWTNLVQERVDDICKEKILPVCTDIRYAQYSEDELYWLKNVNNGIYIHINRYLKDGTKVLPANNDEKENEPILAKSADFTLNWQTSDDFEFLVDTVKIQLSNLLEIIYEKYEKSI